MRAVPPVWISGGVEVSVAPLAIRAACRAEFYAGLERINEIIQDEDSTASEVTSAMRLLGQMGLGAADQGAIHLHAGGDIFVGVVALPALGEEVPLEAIEGVAVPPDGVATEESEE